MVHSMSDHNGEPPVLAIIGGTSVYALADLQGVESITPSTPYGEPSGPIRLGTLHGKRVAFLARHGLHAADFLRVVWAAGDNDARVASYVKTGKWE